MFQTTPAAVFQGLLRQGQADAVAWMQGGASWPQVAGSVRFYRTPYDGVLVEAQIFGLPNIQIPGSSDFYGMHIHEYGDCTRPFTQAGDHYNPGKTLHPQHAGDLPPLLGNQGYAYMVFYDKRFLVDQIVGKSVIIHEMADDFHTQPSGDSGGRIACGVIRYADGRQPQAGGRGQS